MAGPHTVEPNAARRERSLVTAGIALVVVLRSAVLVFWEQAHFDADQAVVGLMAKHLAELRAFPLFYYGQNYMLGVQAWLAAPVFLIVGVSVATLKLPLLAVNVIIAVLLLRIFERDVGLRPALAAVPVLFVALPAPGTAAHLLTANGGSVEPFAYALLLWLTRLRPNWGGVIFAVGFLHREFTLYAGVALLAIEALQGTLFTRDGIRRRLTMVRVAAGVWLFVQWLKNFSSAVGPGTTVDALRRSHDNIVSLTERVCIDLQALPGGLWALVTTHWPVLFGARVQSLAELGVESTVWQGMPGGWLLLAAAILLAATGVGIRIATERRWRREYDACAYLVLVGLLSSVGYVVGRCGQLTLMRYELLSLLGAAGLGAWFLRATPWRAAARAWIAIACAFVASSAVSHGRLLFQYVSKPPINTRRVIASNLEARGIRYASADYRLAYTISFLTEERVKVASEDVVRIVEYQRLVEEHASEAFRISLHSWCDGFRQIPQTGLYVCPPTGR
jgi:hypothetical protein